MKNIIFSMVVLLLLTSCSGGIIDKSLGAGIDIISTGIFKEMQKEEVEVTFPITEIKIQKLKWYQFWDNYEDKVIKTDTYEISISFDKDSIYVLVNVSPSIIKGQLYNHGSVEFEIKFNKLKNKKFAVYDSYGNPFHITLINTENYIIIRIQKMPVIFEVDLK